MTFERGISMIEKKRSLVTSEIVFTILQTFELDVDGCLDTFNNCRETGLCLDVYSVNGKALKHLGRHIWVHEHRNSDSIVVRYGETEGANNMFSEETYLSGTKIFSYNQYYEAAYYVKTLIENMETIDSAE
jgi:hypothetical protein